MIGHKTAHGLALGQRFALSGLASEASEQVRQLAILPGAKPDF